MVSYQGIQANLEKIQVIQEMTPRSIKEVQGLTGKVVAFNHHFMSRLVEKCLPFFKILEQSKNFQWTIEGQKIFEELKAYPNFAPLLNRLEPSEEHFFYLPVSLAAISMVLIQEKRKIQKPLYYINKILHDAETRYKRLENDHYRKQLKIISPTLPIVRVSRD